MQFRPDLKVLTIIAALRCSGSLFHSWGAEETNGLVSENEP